jgi:hypothetical protein
VADNTPRPVVEAPNNVVPVPVPPVSNEPKIRRLTIPAGTFIAVRTVDAIDSESAKLGQTFRATLDAPLTVDSETLAPRGADVDLRVTHVESAGSLKGQSKVSLELARLVVAGKSYTVATNVYEKEAASQTGQTVKRTGIGAGLGAIVGGIVGGAKGAAIGAGVGGGTGVAIEATGKGPQVHIDSESRLEFHLEQPLEVTLESKSSSSDASRDSRDAEGPRALTPRTVRPDNSGHDVSGKWRLLMNGTQANRNMELTLKQNGDRLSGTLDNRGRSESVRGTIRGDSVTFSTSPSSDSDQDAGMRFEGRIADDRMSGTMTSNQSQRNGGFGGRSGSREGNRSGSNVTWSAERDD